MKKTIAITSALAAASSLATAEIKINEFLSFAGFVDASYSHSDSELSTSGASSKDSENSFAIDQVEIDWMFNFGKVTAQVDLQYENGANGDDDATEVEQAFVNYDLGNGLVITAGRYESVLGLEAKEPTGLYQYSTAYGDNNILPQYAQGVKLTKTVGDNVYSLSLQDESFEEDADRLGGDGDSSYAIEAGASIALSDGLTWFIGGAHEDADAGDSYVINTHLTYVADAWTYGAEVSYGDSERGDSAFVSPILDVLDGIAAFSGDTIGDDFSIDDADIEVLQLMIMANYAYSDCCSVTGRISYINTEASGSDASATVTPLGVVNTGPFSGIESEVLKYTLAHNYAVTDNLAVITEISYIDGEAEDFDTEALVGAVEVLFTF